MAKKKDRNESTTVILREFNCELIEKLKKFTNEKTASKAIMLVCARYLALEKLADEQREKINEFERKQDRIESLYRQTKECSSELQKLILG